MQDSQKAAFERTEHAVSVVYRTEEEFEIYYSVAPEIGLANIAAIAGGQATLMWVRGMKQMTKLEHFQEVLNLNVTEMLVINIPRKMLAWAGHGEFVHTPRLLNYLLEKSWYQWKAVWAPEGFYTLIRFVSPKLQQKTAFTPISQDGETFEIDPLTDKSFVIGSETGEFNLLTLKTSAKQIYAISTGYALIEITKSKPKDLITAIKTHGTTIDFNNYQNLEYLPGLGVHIDEASKTVTWWARWNNFSDETDFDKLWSGWSIRAQGDSHEWHEKILGLSGILSNTGKDMIGSLQYFEHKNATLHRHEKLYDLVQICESLWLRYAKIPAELEGLPRSGSNVEYHLQNGLEDLFAGAKLPQARWIDRHGTVHAHQQ